MGVQCIACLKLADWSSKQAGSMADGRAKFIRRAWVYSTVKSVPCALSGKLLLHHGREFGINNLRHAFIRRSKSQAIFSAGRANAGPSTVGVSRSLM